MTEIDRNKFATISRLVGLFGNRVSSDAIRRYIKRYKDYFTVVYDGGIQHIEIESGLKVLTVIHGAIRPGQNRGGHDVLDALKAAGIEPVPQAQPESDTSVKHVAPDTDVVKVLSEIKDVMTEIKDALKKGG